MTQQEIISRYEALFGKICFPEESSETLQKIRTDGAECWVCSFTGRTWQPVSENITEKELSMMLTKKLPGGAFTGQGKRLEDVKKNPTEYEYSVNQGDSWTVIKGSEPWLNCPGILRLIWLRKRSQDSLIQRV